MGFVSYLEIEDIGGEASLLRKETHKFAEEVMRPAAKKLDQMDPIKVAEKGSPYWDVFKKMKKLGYHRIWVPPEHEGLGLSPIQIHVIYEELGWGSVGLSTAIGVDSILPGVISLVGSPEIVEEIVIPWMRDDEGRYHGCWAVTEPEHGSDWLLAPNYPTPREFGKGQVRAQKVGDKWVINGAKSSWISSAPVATHSLLHVVFPDRDYSMAEAGMALVPLDLKGVTKGPPIDKLGLRDDPQGEIVFDNVRIPEDYMIVLAPDFYPYFASQLLCCTSCFMATAFTGLARAAFEEAYRYAKERIQGGKPLIEHHMIKMKLYKMFERIETSRYYSRKVLEHVWDRVFKKKTYDASVAHALSAQVYCTNSAYEVAHEALQIFGGYGLTKEFLVEKLYRDARCSLIMDGVNEILSLSAAYELDKRRVLS